MCDKLVETGALTDESEIFFFVSTFGSCCNFGHVGSPRWQEDGFLAMGLSSTSCGESAISSCTQKCHNGSKASASASSARQLQLAKEIPSSRLSYSRSSSSNSRVVGESGVHECSACGKCTRPAGTAANARAASMFAYFNSQNLIALEMVSSCASSKEVCSHAQSCSGLTV